MNQYLKQFSFFIFCFFIFSILPGPTYIAALFFLLLFLLTFIYKDLSFALLILYFFSLFWGRPFITFSGKNIQDYVYFKELINGSVPMEVPLRFVIAVFFILSLLNPKKINFSFSKKLGKLSRFFFITASLLVFSLVFNQVISTYKVKYNFEYFQLLQMFLMGPAIFIFLNQRRNKDSLSSVKSIIVGLAMAACLYQGILSIAQFILRSPVDLNLERSFSLASIRAPETNLFRSPGNFGHPNLLGVMMSIFLCFSPMFYANNVKNIQNKRLFLLALTCTIFGVVALILSFSRWTWIIAAMCNFIFFRKYKKVLGNKVNIYVQFLLKKKTYFFLVLLIAFVILLTVLVPRFGSFTTFEGRADVFRSYSRIIQHNILLGVGPGLSVFDLSYYRYDYDSYLNSLKQAHNTLLILFADNGLIFTTVFMIYIFSLCIIFFKYRTKILEDDFTFTLFISVLACFLSFQAYSLYTYDPVIEIFMIFSSIAIFTLEKRVPALQYAKKTR